MDNLILKKKTSELKYKNCISTSIFLPNLAKYNNKSNVYLLGLIRIIETFDKLIDDNIRVNKGEVWKLRVYYDAMFDYKYDKKYPEMLKNSTYKNQLTNNNKTKKAKNTIIGNLENKNNKFNYLYNAIKYYLNYVKKNIKKYKYIELVSYEYKKKKLIKIPGHDETFGSLVRFEAFFDKSLDFIYSVNCRNGFGLELLSNLNKWILSGKKIITTNTNYYLNPIVNEKKSSVYKTVYDKITEYYNIPKKYHARKYSMVRYAAGVFGFYNKYKSINIDKLRKQYNEILSFLVDKLNYKYGIDEYLLCILFYYEGMIFYRYNKDPNDNHYKLNPEYYYFNRTFNSGIDFTNENKLNNSIIYNTFYYVNCIYNLSNNQKIPSYIYSYVNKESINLIKKEISNFRINNKTLLSNLKKIAFTGKITDLLITEYKKLNNLRYKLFSDFIIIYNINNFVATAKKYENINNYLSSINDKKQYNFINNIINHTKDLFLNSYNINSSSMSLILFKTLCYTKINYYNINNNLYLVNYHRELKPLIIYNKVNEPEDSKNKRQLNITRTNLRINVDYDYKNTIFFDNNKNDNDYYTLYDFTNKSYQELVKYCIGYYNKGKVFIIKNNEDLNKFLND